MAHLCHAIGRVCYANQRQGTRHAAASSCCRNSRLAGFARAIQQTVSAMVTVPSPSRFQRAPPCLLTCQTTAKMQPQHTLQHSCLVKRCFCSRLVNERAVRAHSVAFGVMLRGPVHSASCPRTQCASCSFRRAGFVGPESSILAEAIANTLLSTSSK